jgi:hypothetical protein
MNKPPPNAHQHDESNEEEADKHVIDGQVCHVGPQGDHLAQQTPCQHGRRELAVDGRLEHQVAGALGCKRTSTAASVCSLCINNDICL